MTKESEPVESKVLGGESDARRRVGARIVALRRRKGWLQAELARRLGVGRARLGKWETGEHAPPLGMLIALKEALEVSFDELLGMEPLLPEGGVRDEGGPEGGRG